MQNLRRTFFISDLHLDENQQLTTDLFLNFLQSLDEQTDALYILGDLFEVWIGDDNKTCWHQKIINSIRSVSDRGIPIYFQHGNRDFLIKKQFLNETNCILLPEIARINLYGTPLLLMHGDTLCIRDIAYIKSRKKMRNAFIQFLFLLLPLKLRKLIANKARLASKKHTLSTSLDRMDVTQEEVVKVMQRYKTHHLIHGHTHQPGFHQFEINQQLFKRMVLGAWHDAGNALIWDSNGKIEWFEF